ncbi:MAG: hypothetical protein LUG49_06935 [Oscillospiraceae bacterium]|nr:hypothetical protein [Oscillospiraceae bacterium]
MRGRDIKRYSYDFADLWLIATFPSRHYNIDDYPAVRDYLLSFGMEQLEQTGIIRTIDGKQVKARKKTNNKWFETQDSISYWDDFSKQKIVYREISSAMDACLVEPDVMLNNKCYMVTGEHLVYLLAFFNSSIFTKMILPQANLTGGKGDDFLKKIKAIYPDKQDEEMVLNEYEDLVQAKTTVDEFDKTINAFFYDLYKLTEDEKALIERRH